jgi:pimeloyl-ACP methyl ester carboxylesterase
VSGVSIRPADDIARDEAVEVHTTDPWWTNILLQEPDIMGVDEAAASKLDSLKFTFDPPSYQQSRHFPPTLVLRGQRDTAMARRDFDLLSFKVKRANPESESMILENSWHFHAIDHPKLFAKILVEWMKKE